MTTAGGLEEGYRRLLRWYPPSYRGRHEEEIRAMRSSGSVIFSAGTASTRRMTWHNRTPMSWAVNPAALMRAEKRTSK